ncbi:hypothetical protein Nepgr_010575 [Nepenthes gracilis]|uniref:Uncharacterized protein n=1 Tax=Nepenthes gracilis TaxID=150966 RepID=A0AAD3SCL9_NEPGR|nr:hypothetical protein Nepgr_010575 [Nepenthes gracilis]
MDIKNSDLLYLPEQNGLGLEDQTLLASREISGLERENESDNEEGGNKDDAELLKRLSKQRQQAMAAAHGRRRNLTSRNSYKDRGGKSSQNSKIQKQLSGWREENVGGQLFNQPPLAAPKLQHAAFGGGCR